MSTLQRPGLPGSSAAAVGPPIRYGVPGSHGTPHQRPSVRPAQRSATTHFPHNGVGRPGAASRMPPVATSQAGGAFAPGAGRSSTATRRVSSPRAGGAPAQQQPQRTFSAVSGMAPVNELFNTGMPSVTQFEAQQRAQQLVLQHQAMSQGQLHARPGGPRQRPMQMPHALRPGGPQVLQRPSMPAARAVRTMPVPAGAAVALGHSVAAARPAHATSLQPAQHGPSDGAGAPQQAQPQPRPPPQQQEQQPKLPTHTTDL
jgi:hypothetical protein